DCMSRHEARPGPCRGGRSLAALPAGRKGGPFLTGGAPAGGRGLPHTRLLRAVQLADAPRRRGGVRLPDALLAAQGPGGLAGTTPPRVASRPRDRRITFP